MGKCAVDELKALQTKKVELDVQLNTVQMQIAKKKAEMSEKTEAELTTLLKQTVWVLGNDRYVSNEDKEIVRATNLSEDGLSRAMENFLEPCYDESVLDWSINTGQGVKFELSDAPTMCLDNENFGFDINDLLQIMYTLDLLAFLELNVTFDSDIKASMLSQLGDIRNGINRLMRIVRSNKFYRRKEK